MNLFGKKEYAFASCMQGRIMPLEEVSDPVFSSKSMGEGFAYLPTAGKVVAPFDGEVIMVFKTKHAIGIKDKSGLEFLIHIGLDTVNLKGDGFIEHVAVGDRIKKGQLLVEFDMDFIVSKACSLESCIILTNLYKRFSLLVTGEVAFGQQGIFSIR
jgi:glucose-specific phosphotransferase system IIA component